MIKNIIFDCSETLLRFEAIDYLASLVGDRDRAVRIHYTMFKSPAWHLYDNGKLPEDEVEGALLPLLPQEDRAVAARYLQEWITTYSVLDGIPELLDDVRSAGYGMYILSDFPPSFRRLWEKFEFLDDFDGCVVSFEVGCSKKDGTIYDILLEKYGLDPAECIFIDDVPLNVEIGEEHGISGILFTGVENLRRELNERGLL